MRRTAAAATIGGALLMLTGAWARAASYEFLAAPETDLNRVYRLDKATGEMGACQYGLAEKPAGSSSGTSGAPDATVGTTLCYPPGEGAGPQSQSEYALVASRHEKEGGVFRVDVRTGTMSICYVLNDKVVCTPPAR